MSTEVTAVNETALIEALQDARNDATETDWVLIGHPDGNPNVIDVVACGSDGPEGLASALDNSQVMYGLVRISEVIDMSTTTKFVYIKYIGSEVSFVKRGKYGVVSGSVEKYFNPYQVSFDADSQDDVTQEAIMSRIQENSGTKSKVLEASEGKTRPERGFTSASGSIARVPTSPTGVAPKISKVGGQGSSFTGFTSQAKGSSGMSVNDDVRQAIANVHSDDSEISWCLAWFEDNNIKNPFCLIETGTGDSTEMTSLLTPEMAAYGLVRMTDIVDDIATVKFVYVQWVGESVKPMAKAKVATKKGAVEALFTPFHVNIYATLPAEVSQRVLTDKVASASGSKSHVR